MNGNINFLDCNELDDFDNECNDNDNDEPEELDFEGDLWQRFNDYYS